VKERGRVFPKGSREKLACFPGKRVEGKEKLVLSKVEIINIYGNVKKHKQTKRNAEKFGELTLPQLQAEPVNVSQYQAVSLYLYLYLCFDCLLSLSAARVQAVTLHLPQNKNFLDTKCIIKRFQRSGDCINNNKNAFMTLIGEKHQTRLELQEEERTSKKTKKKKSFSKCATKTG